jgi:DNA-directed RNA polymerase III subunit RPC6
VDQATICSCAKLTKSEVTKALNQLVGQQRIKDIRCFTNKAKKLYMLYELEPSANVTGGTFYTEARDIDSAFIDAVRGRVTQYIQQKAAASVSQIKSFLDADAQMKRLSMHDVEVIVGSLELDGVIERISGTSEFELSVSRSVTRHGLGNSPGALLTHFPCVGCPYLERCGAAGVGPVNPISCTYLTTWLQGNF